METTSFAKDLAAVRLPRLPGNDQVVGESELAAYAATIRRYFHFMGVVGRPRIWSFGCQWTGRFRRSAMDPFRRCEAWQYNSSVDVARVFRLNIHYAPLISLIAHDTYVRGHGRMTGKLLDRFPVVDATGPELDTGELVTWLNDAILIAPSMLLTRHTRFVAVDDRTFDVALTDRGRTVTGRVHLDARGAPRDFSTHDRYVQEGGDTGGPFVKAEWRTPVDGWINIHGRSVPTTAAAVWMLSSGPLTYAEMALKHETLEYNVGPAEP